MKVILTLEIGCENKYFSRFWTVNKKHGTCFHKMKLYLQKDFKVKKWDAKNW
jgi:hypothetical protein